MEEKLRKLYKKVILQHNTQPYNFQNKTDAPVILEAYNPLCGDKFTLFIDLEGTRITEAAFYGFGCAISKASTSVLAKKLVGLELKEVTALMKHFYGLLEMTEKELAAIELDEELEAFTGVQYFPSRVRCVTLSWDSLRAFVDGQASNS